MGEQKYQHYVPQTYLNKWLDDNNQIHLYNKNSELIKSCKTTRVMGINDLYTKDTDYLLACTEVEKKEIFECLNGYDIYLKEKRLINIEDLCNNYYCFDEWIIKDKTGNKRSKKIFKSDIEKVRILSLEKSLSYVENRWNNIYTSVLNLIDGNKSEEMFIKEQMDELKKFIFIQDWRTIGKIDLYKGSINKIMGFLKDDNQELLNEIVNEFSKCFFLETIENFINGVTESVINTDFNKFKMAHMKIFKVTGNKKFLTNDNPVLYVDNKKLQYGIYYPISPGITLGFFKGDNNKISIEEMPDNSVRELNKIIKREANEFYISSIK